MGPLRCCQSVFYAHCLYFWYSLPKTGEKKKEVNFDGKETSCHKRLNWARLARQISQPTACFPSMTSFAASHRRLRSHLVPLSCYSWVFAGFLGFRNFSFIDHFSSLFMSYFKLQQPVANHTVL